MHSVQTTLHIQFSNGIPGKVSERKFEEIAEALEGLIKQSLGGISKGIFEGFFLNESYRNC